MNSKIKELIFEANGFYQDCCETDIICFEEKDLEKFIELFVEDSIKVMKENDYHGGWLGQKVKEYFEINEHTK